MTTMELEYRIAKFMNPRSNLVVPNVYWGLGLSYEADLIVVTPSGYVTEIELKISKTDIKRDLKKQHQHKSELIRRFFYGVPDYLQDCEFLPVDAGLIVVNSKKIWGGTKIVRPPRQNKFARKLNDGEIRTLLGLAAMRIWGLKEALHYQKIQEERRKTREKEEELK